jgi:hypothetical protein
MRKRREVLSKPEKAENVSENFSLILVGKF